MMHQKAILFNDRAAANGILATPDPAEQQQIGRTVQGFDAATWDNHKIGIVWTANYLKFTQHQDLKTRLLATQNKVLVEASPYDLVWGVGFRANDDQILDENNWRGQNLLGYTLMSVRAAVALVF